MCTELLKEMEKVLKKIKKGGENYDLYELFLILKDLSDAGARICLAKENMEGLWIK